jgi:hypothetical protein
MPLPFLPLYTTKDHLTFIIDLTLIEFILMMLLNFIFFIRAEPLKIYLVMDLTKLFIYVIINYD